MNAKEREQFDNRMKFLIRTETQRAINAHEIKYHRPKNPRCPECDMPLAVGATPRYKNKPAEFLITCMGAGCGYKMTMIEPPEEA